MPVSYTWESHRAQDIELRILDFEHDNLTTPINDKTKALITVQQKDWLMDAECAAGTRDGKDNTENGLFYPGYYYYGDRADMPRYKWLNDTYYNAFPETFKTLIKECSHECQTSRDPVTYETTDDRAFLLSEYEICGGSYANIGQTEGTQYEFYKQSPPTAADSKRYKLPVFDKNSSSAVWWGRTHSITIGDRWTVVNGKGEMSNGNPSANYGTGTGQVGLAPAICL
jgi:hypothetical protein